MKKPFVMVNTDHGAMIVSHLDYCETPDGSFGIGYKLFEYGAYDPFEVETGIKILDDQRKKFGDGVVVVDGGANIGVMTVAWSRHMRDWGRVIAVEAQERIFYALAGNITLANAFNAIPIHAALGAQSGIIQMPVPDYFSPCSLGSLSLCLKPGDLGDTGQVMETKCPVRVMSIDDMGLERLDLLKLDIEGMEEDALVGAKRTIERCRPVIVCEIIKSNVDRICSMFSGYGYDIADAGINIVAKPK